jgi:hypothetical protein
MAIRSKGSHQSCSAGSGLEKSMRRRWDAGKTYQMRCLDLQGKLWTARKGRPEEWMTRRCHLFQVPIKTLGLKD